MLDHRYAQIRARTLALAEPLSEADCQAQSMPDASPVKWHLAHTTWFFETFVLERHEPGFRPHDPAFRVLFNSYYNGIGEQHPRPQRGLITRPGLAEVKAYRAAVDARMAARLAATPGDRGLTALVELGLQHEQQHQELILTDLLHLLSVHPGSPVYQPADAGPDAAPGVPGWLPFDGGLVEVGHTGDGFAFDNEGPRHRQFLRPYALGRRLVTQGEWAQFVADGGYREPRWWLSSGWDFVRTQRLEAPLYWRPDGTVFTLHGCVARDPDRPVLHLSLYEADAYARWWSAQHPRQPPARLPTEFEWEHAAAGPQLQQRFDPAWQWTASAYAPYPGFRAWDGAVGEYNAKFMVNQYVLRGGSRATPAGHSRVSYRNFFPAEARWQFSGLRLAHDVD
jgi:ergothioneine biosynthesis protein EgtB